jgi:hypothetical protein
MAKRTVLVSDISGKDITDHVQLIVKREGHAVKIGKTTYIGGAVLDLDADELESTIGSITFEKQVAPSIFATQGTSEPATAMFSKPGGVIASEVEKVSVVSSDVATEDSSMKEIP